MRHKERMAEMIRSIDNRSDMDSTREAEVVALRKRVKELELQLEIEQEARRRESRTVQNLLEDRGGMCECSHPLTEPAAADNSRQVQCVHRFKVIQCVHCFKVIPLAEIDTHLCIDAYPRIREYWRAGFEDRS